MLRLRLSALESVVHTLRSEMFAVKHALGPWYRPDLQAHPAPDEPYEDLEASSQAFERQLAEELSAHPSTRAEAAATASTNAVDIASYFPPAEDNAAERLTHHRHQRATSTSGPYGQLSAAQTSGPVSPPGSYPAMFPSNSSNAAYPPTTFPPSGSAPGPSYQQGASYPGSAFAVTIPPLDTTTSLPDTLASIHSSLGTLAGALGALAASRGTESLRTNEELRGIRGAMHGLRLQVRLAVLYLGTRGSRFTAHVCRYTTFSPIEPTWTISRLLAPLLEPLLAKGAKHRLIWVRRLG